MWEIYGEYMTIIWDKMDKPDKPNHFGIYDEYARKNMIRHDKASQYMPIWDIRGSLSGDLGNMYVGNIYIYIHMYIYIYMRKYSRQQFSDVHSSLMSTSHQLISPAARGSRRSTLSHGRKKRSLTLLWDSGIQHVHDQSRTSTSISIGSQPIHRLSAVRSALGARWSHGNLQLLRHPGPPALLQVIGLGANGGGLTIRRCRRRTNRAATTQASPSERMLLRLRRSMTRLDPKRAAAAARCLTVQLEV